MEPNSPVGTGVGTATLTDVPNSPKPGTKIRHFRYPDDEWEAARAAAVQNGETVSDVIHRSLRAYVKKTARDAERRDQEGNRGD